MIRENKLKYLISSILIILPALVGAAVTKSSGINAVKGGAYFTWLMPIVLFAVHTFLLWLTRYIDPVKQSKKIENIIFFIIPTISLSVSSIFIALMLGLDLNISMICSVIMGITFIVIGNYMPKAKRNRTFGIKLKWTMANDDNWVATHRLAGKLFVIAGILSFATALLPVNAMFISLVVILAIIVILPTVYSYRFYKKQIASGEATEEDYSYSNQKWQKNTTMVASIIAVLAVVLVVVMLVSGKLKFEFGEDAIKIQPSFGGGVELEYLDLVDATIEYRDEKVPGTRVMGYGSMKLLYGTFHNDEFGNYTRYTYTDSEASIVIYIGDDVIVLADETAELTRALYDELRLKIEAAKN